MPTVETREGGRAVEAPNSSDNLALLYQGLLTGIVRMQSRRQHIPDVESFRRRTKAALQQLERDAVSAGYEIQDVRDTHFAVVAFLDAVILNSNDPVRAEWERRTLQEEIFDKTDAGVVFFEKLETLRARRDSQQLADVLEVYLLCLLLGFEGRFSGGLRGELSSVTDGVRRRIDDIRGRVRQISPAAALPQQAAAVPVPAKESESKRRLLLITLISVALTVVCYILLKLNLISIVARARGKLF